MQAAFTLPRPMLPATAPAGTTSIKPAACSEVGVQSASASPGVVVSDAEGPHNLLPYTGQHVAGLCNQAVPNRRQSKLGLSVPFPRACVQYRCVKCSRSVDVAHNFGERTPQEHRTGDGSYVPCSGTFLPYVMPKLLHDATSFDLLPPGVKLDKTTLRVDVAYCVRVDARKNGYSYAQVQEGRAGPHIVEGMWLGAELLAWEELLAVESGFETDQYQVRVYKAGVDPHTPSDGTQPTMPDKEQLQLEALRSRRALLQDLRSAGSAVMLRLYQHAARVAAEYAARVAAEQAAAHAAAAQAAHAELVSMRSAVQSEATALNEAMIAHFTTEVRSWVARTARFHASRRARLALKRQLRYGALECACSHTTVYNGVTYMGDEDVRRALAQGHVDLLSLRARHDADQRLLAGEQRQQERWRRESPSTDALRVRHAAG